MAQLTYNGLFNELLRYNAVRHAREREADPGSPRVYCFSKDHEEREREGGLRRAPSLPLSSQDTHIHGHITTFTASGSGHKSPGLCGVSPNYTERVLQVQQRGLGWGRIRGSVGWRRGVGFALWVAMCVCVREAQERERSRAGGQNDAARVDERSPSNKTMAFT